MKLWFVVWQLLDQNVSPEYLLTAFILGWTIIYPGRGEGKFSLEELFLSLELCQPLFYSVKVVQELFYNFCILHVVAGFFPSLRGDVHIQVATQNIKLTFLCFIKYYVYLCYLLSLDYLSLQQL